MQKRLTASRWFQPALGETARFWVRPSMVNTDLLRSGDSEIPVPRGTQGQGGRNGRQPRCSVSNLNYRNFLDSGNTNFCDFSVPSVRRRSVWSRGRFTDEAPRTIGHLWPIPQSSFGRQDLQQAPWEPNTRRCLAARQRIAPLSPGSTIQPCAYGNAFSSSRQRY